MVRRNIKPCEVAPIDDRGIHFQFTLDMEHSQLGAR
jgi:hypothetical protein